MPVPVQTATMFRSPISVPEIGFGDQKAAGGAGDQRTGDDGMRRWPNQRTGDGWDP
jgi:hypothetical protein